MSSYTVLRDQREKIKWDFPKSKDCAGTIETTLKTGDYTLAGYEHLLCIERKGTTAEFAKNITEARFKRELARMELFKYPFIICEFTMDDILNFPANSGIPTYLWKKIRIKPYYILKEYLSIEVSLRSKIILAGSHGKEICSSIFKRVIENENIVTPTI